MKINIRTISVLLFVALLAACSKKQGASENISSDEWPEMDAFHMVMAEAYHPYKDSANVGPVRQLAEELATEAARWQAAPLPEKVNNDEVKSQLEKLKNDTRSLTDRINAGAADKEIGEALTALHDLFHGITEAWNKE
jgi:hypothetical protein